MCLITIIMMKYLLKAKYLYYNNRIRIVINKKQTQDIVELFVIRNIIKKH